MCILKSWNSKNVKNRNKLKLSKEEKKEMCHKATEYLVLIGGMRLSSEKNRNCTADNVTGPLSTHPLHSSFFCKPASLPFSPHSRWKASEFTSPSVAKPDPSLYYSHFLRTKVPHMTQLPHRRGSVPRRAVPQADCQSVNFLSGGTWASPIFSASQWGNKHSLTERKLFCRNMKVFHSFKFSRSVY